MVLTKQCINNYVLFILKCLNDKYYIINLTNNYNKKNKRKCLNKTNEVISILNFIKSSKELLKWTIDMCKSNANLITILYDIDHLGDNLGNISIIIKKTSGICMIDNQNINYPRLLYINEHQYSINVKYLPFIKAFYTIRYCYQYVKKSSNLHHGLSNGVILTCCDILLKYCPIFQEMESMIKSKKRPICQVYSLDELNPKKEEDMSMLT
jgi:hypothetical protein